MSRIMVGAAVDALPLCGEVDASALKKVRSGCVRGRAKKMLSGASVGDLPMGPVWTMTDRETWEPRGLGDWRTSNAYSRYPEERRYTGEAIPYMVGDLSLMPVWGRTDSEVWEPRGIGDFRTSKIYGAYPEERRYMGEGIPYMVGDLDVGYGDPWQPHGIGDPPPFPSGDALPYAVGSHAAKAAAARSEGLAYIGNVNDESGIAFMLGAARRRRLAMQAAADMRRERRGRRRVRREYADDDDGTSGFVGISGDQVGIVPDYYLNGHQFIEAVHRRDTNNMLLYLGKLHDWMHARGPVKISGGDAVGMEGEFTDE